MRKLFNAFAVIALCASAPSMAHASTLTFLFTTEVTLVTSDPSSILGRPVAVGDVLHGHLMLQTVWPDAYPEDPHFGRYEYAADSGFAEIALDTPTPVIARTLHIDVGNALQSSPYDSLLVQGHASIPAIGSVPLHFAIDALQGGLWSSDAPPAVGIPAAMFANLNTSFILNSTIGGLRGRITSFDLVTQPEPPDTPDPPAVPEPASLLLLGTGLVGLASRARARVAR